MENIREQLVKRQPQPNDSLVKYGSYVIGGTLILGEAVIFFSLGGLFAVIGILAITLTGWGTVYFSGLVNVEYEYCIAGPELSIDKIVDQKKRKTLCSLNLKNADGFYRSRKQLQNVTVVSAEGEGEAYTIEYTDPKYGRTLIYFTPDERTLEMITKYLPRLS